jgi:imidazolonepropionase-like amidohydrolase
MKHFRSAAPLAWPPADSVGLRALGAFGVVGALCALAAALPPSPVRDDPKPQDEKQDGKGSEDGEKKEEAEKDRWFAAVGGDVFTGNGGVLRGATVLAKNGKIDQIGFDVDLPPETEVLDATGYRVYPGLVAISASTRVTQGGMMDGGDEEYAEACCSEFQDPSHVHEPEDADAPPEVAAGAAPEALPAPDEIDEIGESGAADEAKRKSSYEPNDLRDSYDPFAPYLILALATGITTAEQSGAAVKLKRGELEGVVLREKYLSTFSWTGAQAGKQALRKKFVDAAQYLRDYTAWEEVKEKDKEAKEPSKKDVDSKVLAVLQGRARAKFNANGAADLVGIARLAQDFGFRPVIEGCVEGWTVASELGRAGAAAIVTARTRRDKDEHLSRDGGSSIENAAVLHDHGVQVAIASGSTSFDMSGITGRDLLALAIEAGFAVRGGMSDEDALASITIVPARILGVEHRVGTLEVGKDCDLAITDGDLLHYQTLIHWTVVEGKVAYDKQKEIYFADIRPRAEAPAESDTDAAAEDGEPGANGETAGGD